MKTVLTIDEKDTVKSLLVLEHYAFLTLESGLRIEMSRSQIDSIVLEYGKARAIADMMADIK